MLQTRGGKRGGQAAVKIAVDMVDEGLVDTAQAIMMVGWLTRLTCTLICFFLFLIFLYREPASSQMSGSPGTLEPVAAPAVQR